MTSVPLAFLILWLILPALTLATLRRLDLPPLTSALTLTAMVLCGLAISFPPEVGPLLDPSPAAPAQAAGPLQAYLPLRAQTPALALFFWLMGAGGAALIAVGLGQARRSLATPLIAATGIAALHLGAFVTLALRSLPGERLASLAGAMGTDAAWIDIARSSASTAVAAGAVMVLAATLLALIGRLRLS